MSSDLNLCLCPQQYTLKTDEQSPLTCTLFWLLLYHRKVEAHTYYMSILLDWLKGSWLWEVLPDMYLHTYVHTLCVLIAKLIHTATTHLVACTLEAHWIFTLHMCIHVASLPWSVTFFQLNEGIHTPKTLTTPKYRHKRLTYSNVWKGFLNIHWPFAWYNNYPPVNV